MGLIMGLYSNNIHWKTYGTASKEARSKERIESQ
jgi:hypothetical protein